jgi:hypothetical protein
VKRPDAPTIRLGRANDESGAIIVLALAFLTVIGVLTVALITFARVGAVSTTSYRIERTRRYAADSALQSTVQRLAMNPSTTYSSTWTNCGRNTIQEFTGGGNIAPVVATGANVTVQCRNTPNSSSSGIDTDGGQAPRDIEMQVLCTYGASMVVNKQLTCGNASTNTLVIGRARVRFENNYDTALYASNARSVIPKILVWSINTSS